MGATTAENRAQQEPLRAGLQLVSTGKSGRTAGSTLLWSGVSLGKEVLQREEPSTGKLRPCSPESGTGGSGGVWGLCGCFERFSRNGLGLSLAAGRTRGHGLWDHGVQTLHMASSSSSSCGHCRFCFLTLGPCHLAGGVTAAGLKAVD